MKLFYYRSQILHGDSIGDLITDETDDHELRGLEQFLQPTVVNDHQQQTG